MSIKHGLLALLDQGPRYGYQLRSEFEARTGSTWPLNVGQVYTTLGRLDRDGLVAPDGEDAEGHVFYRITEPGRAELRAWFDAPVSRTNPPRDELAIKLAMAVTVPGVDIATVIQGQRSHTLRALQDYTRLKTRAAEDDLAWQLVLESLIFHAEAEVRWLDHCETRLARRAAEHAPAPAVEQPAPPRKRGARR
ncbi:PadR family transcriptional regulator [Embleya sp. NPDC020630]|uniref:PadR family transcriptional regulator n=1 Tax=Embleya sp. NPDC020630 TaxID=3363979 RepID=UPI0037A95D34